MMVQVLVLMLILIMMIMMMMLMMVTRWASLSSCIIVGAPATASWAPGGVSWLLGSQIFVS